jgi:3-oxoacyl-[acyl-carrier-protein] synthase-3
MKIIGTGSELPKKVVSNADLAKLMDTSDEWIKERTGIQMRHVITNEALEDLATVAAQKAIEDAGILPTQLDYIICSNMVNEYVVPSMASIVGGYIGSQCPAYDLNAACTGFLYALDMADVLLKAGRAEYILIISAEEPSRIVDWNDRRTCVLFGDGAAAVVVTKGNSLRSIKVSSRSDKSVLYYRRSLEPTPFLSREEKAGPLCMNGQEVFKSAVTSSLRDMKYVLKQANISKDDVTYYVLHQANMRIIDFIRSHFDAKLEQFPINVNKYGNTSSVSIPLLLDELNREGKLRKGDLLVLSAFGAGFTSAACVLEWNKSAE